MAQYFYPGVLFAKVNIAAGTFTPPASLPVSAGGTRLYDGLRLADLARIGEIDPTQSGYGLYPMVDTTVIPSGKIKLGTFADTLDTLTPRSIVGSRGAETTTKTIARTYDLADAPVAPLLREPDEFIALFTPAETAAILDSANAAVRQFATMIKARRSPINLKSPTLPAKLDALVALNLIAANRKAAILAGTPPA